MKKIACLVLCLTLAKLSMATTYITRMKGYWHQSSTWVNGFVPSYTFSDTVIIKHPVDFNKNLFLNSGAFLRIDTTGGLCGHRNITAYSNAILYKYGLLQLDTMFVTGGKVTLDGPKDAIFSLYGIITLSGASLYVKGCKLSVGPWFECTGDDYESAVISYNHSSKTVLYPNPNNGLFNLQFYSPGTVNTFRVTDMQGKQVMEQNLSGTAASENINMTFLPQGIYCWQLLTDGRLVDKGKICIGNR